MWNKSQTTPTSTCIPKRKKEKHNKIEQRQTQPKEDRQETMSTSNTRNNNNKIIVTRNTSTRLEEASTRLAEGLPATTDIHRRIETSARRRLAQSACSSIY